MARENRGKREEYEFTYDGAAVRVPQRREVEAPAKAPAREHRRRYATRPNVRVREAGRVSPFAVVGFLAAAVLAAMVLFCRVQAMEGEVQIAQLQSQLTALENENAKLTQQYEQLFDTASIEAAVGGSMVRPSQSQYIYVDLSGEDTVTVYAQESPVTGIEKLFCGIAETVGNVVEYFR